MYPQRWAVERISLVEYSPDVWRQVCLWIFLGSLNSVETNEIAVTLKTVIDHGQTQFYNFLWQFLSKHHWLLNECHCHKTDILFAMGHVCQKQEQMSVFEKIK